MKTPQSHPAPNKAHQSGVGKNRMKYFIAFAALALLVSYATTRTSIKPFQVNPALAATGVLKFGIGSGGNPCGDGELLQVDSTGKAKCATSGGNANFGIVGTNTRLGAGTTAPSSSSQLHIANAGGSAVMIIDGNYGTNYEIWQRGQSGCTGCLYFTRNLSDTPDLLIDQSGNVGIGTANPTSKLFVNGGYGASNGVVIQNSSGGGFNLYGGNASPDSGHLQFGDATGWKFHIGDITNNKRFTFTDTGSFGIGTVSPGAKLDVVGGIISTTSTASIGSDSTTFGVLMKGDGAALQGYFNGYYRDLIKASSQRIVIGQSSGVITGIDMQAGDSGTITFNTAGTQKMKIANGGNVGIGIEPNTGVGNTANPRLGVQTTGNAVAGQMKTVAHFGSITTLTQAQGAIGMGAAITLGSDDGYAYYVKIGNKQEQGNPNYLNSGISFQTMTNCYLAGCEDEKMYLSNNGYLQTRKEYYPGRVDSAAIQGSWYLGSHASYGLYSNTGLNLQGPLYINGATRVYYTGNYTTLHDTSGNIRMYLGNSGDPGNYYDNTTHYFRDASANDRLRINFSSYPMAFIDGPASSSIRGRAGFYGGTAFLSANIYYNGGWVHDSDNGAGSMLLLQGDNMYLYDYSVSYPYRFKATNPYLELYAPTNASGGLKFYRNDGTTMGWLFHGAGSDNGIGFLANNGAWAVCVPAGGTGAVVMGGGANGCAGGIRAEYNVTSFEGYTTTGGNNLFANGTMYINPTQDIVLSRFTGNVGIGVAPSYKLHLSTDSAGKPNGGSWTNSSDRRLKENIRPFTDGLSVLKGINPVNYTYNGLADNPKGMQGIGVVAQDVKDVVPYTVSTYKAKLHPEDTKETELYNFNASALMFVNINAIKELDKRTANLTLTEEGNLSLTTTNQVKDHNGNVFSQIGAFAKLVVSNIQVGLLEAKKLVVNGIDVMEKMTQLENKVNTQEQQIKELQKQIEELKKTR